MMKFHINKKNKFNISIYFYFSIILISLFIGINYLLMNYYPIDSDFDNDLYLNYYFTTEVKFNISINDNISSNYNISPNDNIPPNDNISEMKRLGEKSTSIVSTNGSKSITKFSHLVNTDINTIKFDTNKYIQSREIAKTPNFKIGGVEMNFGYIDENIYTDKIWRSYLDGNISKMISLKVVDIPDVKFTKEELDNRMKLTENIKERTQVIIDLEKTQDSYKSKIFFDVKIYYYSINKKEEYESFLLDYYTSNDTKMKVDNLAAEMKESKSAIYTQYDTKNFNNINSPEENSAAFVSTLLNPYNHFCMYYYGPNGEEIFSTFTRASGIVDNRFDGNILGKIFNNDYTFHLISKNKDLKGNPSITSQYASSFIYQEKQINGLISDINLNRYNTLYNFINQQDVYKNIENLISLKYKSDIEITINKLKQVGLIK